MWRALGIPEVLVPLYPGITSAVGLLTTDLKYDTLRTAFMTSERVDCARLNADFGRIVTLPDVQERYASLGVFTEHSTPQQVTERIKADTQSYARLLKAAGIEPE